jgi:hypothetical protein
MIYGLCFDSSALRGTGTDGRSIDLKNTFATGHYDRAEEDYALARSMGITRLTDSVVWDAPGPGLSTIDFNWLDRLAALGCDTLRIMHYALPRCVTKDMFWSGEAADFMHEAAANIARAYKGVGWRYDVCTELGIWTNLIAHPHNRQWPQGNRSWWDVYKQTSAIAIAIAKGLRSADRHAQTMLAEPYGMGHMSYDDMSRPFNTILGRYDEVAEREGCDTWKQGHEGLLDVIGLDIYEPRLIAPMLSEARNRYPGKQVVVAETANTQLVCHPAEWWGRFEDLGEPDLEVTWCPGLEAKTHDEGNWYGAYLINQHRQPIWSAPSLVLA